MNQDNTRKISRQGDIVNIPIRIENKGSYTAENVEVQITIPSGLSLKTSMPTEGTFNGSLWIVGDIAARNEAVLSLVLQVDDVSLAPFTISGQITSGGPDDDSSDNTFTWVISNDTSSPTAGSTSRAADHHGDLSVEDTTCDSGVTKYLQVGTTVNVSQLTLNEDGSYVVQYVDPSKEAKFSYKIQCVLGVDTTDASGPTEITVPPLFAEQPIGTLIAGNPGYHVFSPADGTAATVFKTGWTIASVGDNPGEAKFTYPDGTSTTLSLTQSLTVLRVSNDNRTLVFTDKDGVENIIPMQALVRELQGRASLTRDAVAGTLTLLDGLGGSYEVEYAKEAFLASIVRDTNTDEVVFGLSTGGEVRIPVADLGGPDITTTIVVTSGTAVYTNEEGNTTTFLVGSSIVEAPAGVFTFTRDGAQVAVIDTTQAGQSLTLSTDTSQLLELDGSGDLLLSSATVNTSVDPITKVVTVRGNGGATSTLPLYAAFSAALAGNVLTITHDGDASSADFSALLGTPRVEGVNLIFRDLAGVDSVTLPLVGLNIAETLTQVNPTLIRFVNSQGTATEITLPSGFKSSLTDHETFGRTHNDGDGVPARIFFELEVKNNQTLVLKDQSDRESPVSVPICDGCCVPVGFTTPVTGTVAVVVGSKQAEVVSMPIGIRDNLLDCGCAKTLRPDYEASPDFATIMPINISGDHNSVVVTSGGFTQNQSAAIPVDILCGDFTVGSITVNVSLDTTA